MEKTKGMMIGFVLLVALSFAGAESWTGATNEPKHALPSWAHKPLESCTWTSTAGREFPGYMWNSWSGPRCQPYVQRGGGHATDTPSGTSGGSSGGEVTPPPPPPPPEEDEDPVPVCHDERHYVCEHDEECRIINHHRICHPVLRCHYETVEVCET